MSPIFFIKSRKILTTNSVLKNTNSLAFYRLNVTFSGVDIF